MSKKRLKGLNEIKVKLLPEKAKRDYILRMVSFIIILTFIIINILFVYIPLTNYSSQLNEIKDENATKELERLYLDNKYNFFFNEIYNNDDSTIKDILDSTLDLNTLFLLFEKGKSFVDVHQNLPLSEIRKQENTKNLLPIHSIVQSINFSESNLSFVVTIQFDSFDDLTTYQNNIERVLYVTNVDVGSYNIIPVEGSTPRIKTTFTIQIEANKYCPKVGVGNDE